MCFLVLPLFSSILSFTLSRTSSRDNPGLRLWVSGREADERGRLTGRKKKRGEMLGKTKDRTGSEERGEQHTPYPVRANRKRGEK